MRMVLRCPERRIERLAPVVDARALPVGAFHGERLQQVGEFRVPVPAHQPGEAVSAAPAALGASHFQAGQALGFYIREGHGAVAGHGPLLAVSGTPRYSEPVRKEPDAAGGGVARKLRLSRSREKTPGAPLSRPVGEAQQLALDGMLGLCPTHPNTNVAGEPWSAGSNFIRLQRAL